VRARIAAITLGLALTACGSITAEDVCNTLGDECGYDFPTEQCRAKGGTVERLAEDVGCEDQLEEYLECVDDAGCDWFSACAGENDRLTACMGPFP
jgi:hypothetical protein